MSKGPEGQKCLADVIKNAITFAKIATGEIEEQTENDKDKTAVAGWRKNA